VKVNEPGPGRGSEPQQLSWKQLARESEEERVKVNEPEQTMDAAQPE